MKKTLLLLTGLILFSLQINAQRIAGGEYHTITLCEDSTVWTCGSNMTGQLGIGTYVGYELYPVQVIGLSNVIAVDADGWHCLALKGDGSVWAWGWNAGGQLGNGTIADTSLPVQVAGLSNITGIVAGFSHSLALQDDSTVWAWGWNGAGSLGDSTTIDKLTPVQVTGLTNVIAIDAGEGHSVALREDGTVWTWGWNDIGQLGDGSTTNAIYPIQVTGISNITSIGAGQKHTLAVQNNDSVWAWGSNYSGQLGDSTIIDKYSPVRVEGIANITDVAGGSKHSLAIRNDGTIWSFGYNDMGQLGNDTSSGNSPNPNPVQVSIITNVADIAAGFFHSLAIKNDGSFWGWGQGGTIGDSTGGHISIPNQMQHPCIGTGINEEIVIKNIKIYPNPTEGKFQIQSPKTQVQRVEVYDLFGRKVLESKEPEIDMRGFAKGMYVYVVKGEGESEIGRGKVIIE